LGRLAHGGDQRARLALSFPLGLIGALMRVSDNRFASTVATVYAEIVRNMLKSSSSARRPRRGAPDLLAFALERDGGRDDALGEMLRRVRLW
jgi:hypothetical protein